MPEKSSAGGWRKRIHSRPAASKAKTDDRVLAEEDTQSLIPPSERASWSNSLHSRPVTPNRVSTPAISQHDTSDVRHEPVSEISSPRKPVKPKIARYISGYLSIKEAVKEPDFAEPWNETTPQQEEPTDPLVSVQSVFAHMTTVPARPIPLHFNSVIFRIFEDYRNIRAENERLSNLCNETFSAFRSLETSYEDEKANYTEVIRRLELLITHGTPGMTELAETKQDTVVERRWSSRKTVCTNDVHLFVDEIPFDQLDEQIRLRSQNVLLERPISPSGKMALLSRRLEEAHAASNFSIGTPPNQHRKTALSRKVQSELDFARFAKADLTLSNPQSVETTETIESSFSGRGDPLPDEVRPSPTVVESAVDLDAFMALQELGTLVARKKGINTSEFLNGLMGLYSMPSSVQGYESGCQEEPNKAVYTKSLSHTIHGSESPSTLEHASRQAWSHPRPKLGQIQQKHFSFEPGDDHISAVEETTRLHTTEFRSSSDEEELSSDGPTISSRLNLMLQTDLQKPTMIPSPVPRPVSNKFRREGSDSSVRTERRKTEDTRRESSSSVLTAFRHSSSGSVRPVAQSRSSSMNTPRRDENRHSDSIGGLGGLHNIAAMAAARAVDQVDSSALKSVTAPSISKSSANGLSTRISRLSDKPHRKTVLPQQRF